MFIRFFKALLRDFGQALAILIVCIPALIVIIPVLLIVALLPTPLFIILAIIGWTLYFNWDYIKGGGKDNDE